MSTNPTKQITVIVKEDIKNYLRSAQGIVFIACFAIFYLYFSYSTISGFEQIEKLSELTEAKPDKLDDYLVLNLVSSIFKEIELFKLLKTFSPTLTLLFLYSIFLIPFGALLGTFDQCSGMIGTKYIRFLLPRMDRTDIFIAKFLSAMLIYWILIFLLLLPVGLYASMQSPVSTPSQNFMYFVKIYLCMAVYGLPFIALNAMFGVLIGIPFLVFMVSTFYYLLIGILITISGWSKVQNMGFLKYLSPTCFKYNMLSLEWDKVGVALLASIIFTGIFFILGLFIINKRDL